MTPEERHIKRLEELLKQTPRGFIYEMLEDYLKELKSVKQCNTMLLLTNKEVEHGKGYNSSKPKRRCR